MRLSRYHLEQYLKIGVKDLIVITVAFTNIKFNIKNNKIEDDEIKIDGNAFIKITHINPLFI